MKRNKTIFSLKNLLTPFKSVFKTSLQKEILSKSLDYTSGLETQLINPDDLLKDKGKSLTFYDTMMLDDRLSSIIELKKRMTLSCDSDIKACNGEDDSHERADFFRTMFSNMRYDINNYFESMLDSMVYGFKVGEKIFKVNDKNQWVLNHIRFKHSIFFDFEYDDYSNLDALHIGRYYGYNKGVEVIKGIDNIYNKFIVCTYPYPRDDNYYGSSDLQNVYILYNQKYYIVRWRGIYLQNCGQPVPVVTYDSDSITTAEKNDLTDMLDNFQDNVYIMNPAIRDPETREFLEKFQFNFQDIGTKDATKGFNDAIDQLDMQIARRLLIPDKAGYTTSDGGSYALGKTHFDILMMVIKELHQKIEGWINPTIKQIEKYNFGEQEEYCKFQFKEIDKAIEKEMLQMLIDKEVVDHREQWIRQYVGIPTVSLKEKEEIEKAKEEAVKKAQENMLLNPESTERKTNNKPMQDNEIENEETENSQDKKDIKDPKQDKQEMKNFEQYKNHPTNFKQINDTYNKYEDDFINEYKKIYYNNSEYLVKQIQKKKIIEGKDLKLVASLRINKKPFKQLFNAYYNRLYVTGKTQAIEEIEVRYNNIKKQFKADDLVKFKDEEIELLWANKEWIDKYIEEFGELGKLTPEDKDFLNQLKTQSFYNSGKVEQDMINECYNAIKVGLDSGETMKTIISRVESQLKSDYQKYATTIARTTASDAYNNGRFNLFRSNAVRTMIEAYQYIAILDGVTTQFCESHNEQIIMANDPQLGLINPPNHFNCRSLLSSIFIEEKNNPDSFFYEYDKSYKQFGQGVPIDARLPQKGFGGR